MIIEIDLVMIAGVIGIIGSIWKFANSISNFGSSVEQLKNATNESIEDRRDIRKMLNRHEISINTIQTQYTNIMEDLREIKKEVNKTNGKYE